MAFDFATAARRIQANLDGGLGDGMTSPQTSNRPTTHQADPQTDGLDPAAIGGPAPMNSGQGPYGAPVTTDPLLQGPITPGAAIPHVTGPDVDTTTLH